MSGCGKAVLVLAIAAPVLTEIVSGNTPAHALLNPKIVIFLLLGYSFPLLIIREYSIRWRLSVLGVFLWGLAYGILNEGLLAQTLIRFEHVPINKFDRYIVLGGFNLSWACLIVPWHALFAVVFPITLVHHWFPRCAQKAWLSQGFLRAFASLLVLLILFISLVRVPHAQMAECLFAMVFLVCLGYAFRNPAVPTTIQPSRWIFPIGSLSYIAIFLGLIVLAALRVPALLYFAAAGAAFLLFGLASTARGFWDMPCAANLGLGCYFAATAFSVVGAIVHHSVEAVVTGSMLACVFVSLAYLPRKADAHALPS
jgi:hypothetical protein